MYLFAVFTWILESKFEFTIDSDIAYSTVCIHYIFVINTWFCRSSLLIRVFVWLFTLCKLIPNRKGKENSRMWYFDNNWTLSVVQLPLVPHVTRYVGYMYTNNTIWYNRIISNLQVTYFQIFRFVTIHTWRIFCICILQETTRPVCLPFYTDITYR